MKNHSRILFGATLVASLMLPLVASAQSINIGDEIQSLTNEIAKLEAQLSQLQLIASSSASTSTPQQTPSSHGEGEDHAAMPCMQFERDLSFGDSGGDVSALQNFLGAQGFLSASSTGFFGQMTERALESFQEHFALASSSSGFFGPITRAFLGNHCDSASSTPAESPDASSTMPERPFGQTGSTTQPAPCSGDGNNDAAAVLFVPHAIVPGEDHHPCGQASSTPPVHAPCMLPGFLQQLIGSTTAPCGSDNANADN